MSRNSLSEEIEALKSIYDKDLKSDGSDIVITLFPLQEKEKKEVYVQVDLCVDCSVDYPEKEPGLCLKNVKGLPDRLLETLYGKLNELAKSLRGDVMIYNLAYFVQEFLSEHNKPGKKSCYEEMLIRKEQQKQQEYQSEVYKKTKLMRDLEEKQKQMFEHTNNGSSSDTSEDETEKAEGLNESKSKLRYERSETFCEHRSCKYIQFNNKVLRGRCIEHDTNSVVYCAIDSTTGDQLLLQEWILKPVNKTVTSSSIEEKLEGIQKSLSHLKKLCHENLISYIDFKWSFEKGEWIVHVLQEYITNFNLNVLIEKSSDLDINFIRYILTGILSGLEHLHSHGVVHGCLTGSNIHINKIGAVKLSGYGIKKIMDDLHSFCTEEGSNESPVRQVSRKTDVLDVGLLLLRIMKVSVERDDIVVPDFQPPELKEFAEKCLIENEESRWTARKLLTHKFLKGTSSQPGPGQRKKFSTGEIDSKMSVEMEKPYEEFYDGNENVNSRLCKEFRILNHVGYGSFGKVLKVKNKLDGSIYAIKAIRLSAKNKQIDKKMIREVKLLSKLNHENVVRYYTSWIERDSAPIDVTPGDGDSDVVDGGQKSIRSKSNYVEENDDDDEEEEEEEEEDEYEDEDEGGYESESNSDEVDAAEANLAAGDQSSYVQFVRDDDSKEEGWENDVTSEDSHRKEPTLKEPNRTMYIQMEFCEKSTLRIAINDVASVKLCEDERRLWRLFREIVEGLAYVHGQGMIHRDLKPENIFLDSSDHVKIGDFGLATVSVASKCFWLQAETPFAAGDNASSQNLYDDYHTGRVGTSLYVAPELDKTFGKSFYNKKVDIYSLGIIFFEMCSGRFSTDMERIETLLNLRKFEIILPASWNDKLTKQRNLVAKLLNHDPKSRPSCQEILEGDYLPPAEFEYEHLQDIMRQTLVNPKSKAYKYLILSCFDQEVRIEEDITYQWENVRSEKQYFLLDLVKERMESLLKKHGAVYLSAPLLLPQNHENKNADTEVKLMTHSGSIVNLPHDLRLSFARYLACKAFKRLRRYAVERVYRERKVHGLHPKEQYECAFDLVAPVRCIEHAELEVLSLVEEVITEFKSLKTRNCLIRLNHSFLLKAILIHFNSEKWYSDVFRILSTAKENKYFRNKLNTHLQAIGIQSVNTLSNLFSREDSLGAIRKDLLSLINKRGKTLDALNAAFQKLQNVITGAERLGLNVPIKVALGVVCNSEHCSDIMFDVVYHTKQKGKREGCVTVMSGCRYDGLISSFRRLFELTASTNSDDDHSSAVGLTVYLDRVVTALKEDNTLSDYVVVSSIGSGLLSRAKESVVKKLWEAGIKCYVEQTIKTLEELTDYCRESKILHIVNLKDEDGAFVSVMSWDSDKNHYLEKKIGVRDVTEYILKYSKNSEGHPSPLFSRQISDSAGRSLLSDSLNGQQNVNIHIVTDEKLTSTQRRRYENQIRTQISSIVCRFSSRTRLEVVGVLLDEQRVKDLAINFKGTESSDRSDLDTKSERSGEKKQISKIYSKVRSLLADNSNTIVILYSIPQDRIEGKLETPNPA